MVGDPTMRVIEALVRTKVTIEVGPWQATPSPKGVSRATNLPVAALLVTS